MGPAGVPYLTHEDLRNARDRLKAEGGTFADGVYTKIMPDGRKINKDGHAACFEYITGEKIKFPKGRFDAPIIMRANATRWVVDRKLPGVEHKHSAASASTVPASACGASRPARRFPRTRPRTRRSST